MSERPTPEAVREAVKGAQDQVTLGVVFQGDAVIMIRRSHRDTLLAELEARGREIERLQELAANLRIENMDEERENTKLLIRKTRNMDAKFAADKATIDRLRERVAALEKSHDSGCRMFNGFDGVCDCRLAELDTEGGDEDH